MKTLEQIKIIGIIILLIWSGVSFGLLYQIFREDKNLKVGVEVSVEDTFVNCSSPSVIWIMDEEKIPDCGLHREGQPCKDSWGINYPAKR